MKNKAITLISLVITIIILIILSGVTINLTLGENGLFNKSKQAKEEYNNSAITEEEQLNALYAYLNNEDLPENTTTTEAGTIVKLPDNWKTETMRYVSTENGSEITNVTKVATVYAVAIGDGKSVPVPYGFYYVGGDLSSGVVISDNATDKNKYTGESNVPSGIKLNEDGTTISYEIVGNQFVWIPCEESQYKKCNVWNGTTQTSSSLANSNWDTTTASSEKTQIQKYGGFYVARFEAGLATSIDEFTVSQQQTGSNQIYNLNGVPQSKAGVSPWVFIDWNHSKKNSESMYNTNYVHSGLITGTQWDVMINKIANVTGNSLTDSGSWGNYIDKTPTITLGKTAYAHVTSSSWYLDPFSSTWLINTVKPLGTINTSNNGKSHMWTTGASETAKTYNLYDVAGNVWEWTEETSFKGGDVSTQYREIRGGGLFSASAAYPVCRRQGNHPVEDTCSDAGFRVVLYIK